MNSDPQPEANAEKQQTSAMSKFQAVEFTLTADQHMIIQHYLPKTYVLLERKSNKREKGSTHKFMDPEISKFSGGFENTEEAEGRSKRVRIKKIDRYLEEEAPRINKRNVQKNAGEDDMNNCVKIIGLLKKHPHAVPFLGPVDPKKSGASHYFDIIKEPMDFSTIEKHLKLGEYHSPAQFHADIAKIWLNSYAYNEKNSKIFKMTIEMQKYYKTLLSESPKRQMQKSRSKSIKGQKFGNDQAENSNNQLPEQWEKQSQNSNRDNNRMGM